MADGAQVVYGSFDEMAAADETAYATVEAHGGVFTIGSLSTADMLEWLESNDDKEKSKLGGVRLLVKSLVDKDKQRVPADRFDAMVVEFSQKDARGNSKIINEALAINGMKVKQADRKNDSGEAVTVASPTVTPSPAGAV